MNDRRNYALALGSLGAEADEEIDKLVEDVDALEATVENLANDNVRLASENQELHRNIESITTDLTSLQRRYEDLYDRWIDDTQPEEPQVDPPSPPSPIGYVNAADFGASTSNKDNKKALDDAAAAAVSRNVMLFIPEGKYNISGWAPPKNLIIRGDIDTWLRGPVYFDSNQEWNALTIGSETTSALFPAHAKSRIEHVLFDDVVLRGGGDRATLCVATQMGPVKVEDFEMYNCVFERRYNNTFSHQQQDIQWFTDRSDGGYAYDVRFRSCVFGARNMNGDTGGLQGGAEIWCSYDFPDTPQGNGFDDWLLENNLFYPSNGWIWDFSGPQTPSGGVVPYSWEGQRVEVRNNVFQGAGHVPKAGTTTEYDSGGRYHIALQLEPGFDSIIEKNVFYSCQHNAIKIIKGASRNVVRNNVFDYREPVKGCEPYNWKVIVRCEEGRDNFVDDNVLWVKKGQADDLSADGWIYNDRGTVKRNNTIRRF